VYRLPVDATSVTREERPVRVTSSIGRAVRHFAPLFLGRLYSARLTEDDLERDLLHRRSRGEAEVPEGDRQRLRESLDRGNRERYKRVRRGHAKYGALAVAAALIGSVVFWWLRSRGVRLTPVTVAMLFTVSMVFFVWATLAKGGWAIQTYKGETAPERAERAAYVLLYLLGTITGATAIWGSAPTTNDVPVSRVVELGTSTDWPLLIGTTKDALLGGSALIGSAAAIVGLRTWRRQIRGSTRHEVARRAMRALRSIHSTIVDARQTLLSVASIRYHESEGKPIPKDGPRFDPAESQRNVLDRFWRAHANLRQASGEASDVFDEHARRVFNDVFNVIARFQLVVALLPYVEPKAPAEDPEKKPSILYETREGDAYGSELDSVIHAALRHFRKEL